MKKSKLIAILLSLLIMILISSLVYAVASVNLNNGAGSPSSTPSASPSAPTPPTSTPPKTPATPPTPPPPKVDIKKYNIEQSALTFTTFNGKKDVKENVYLNEFSPDSEQPNDRYAVDAQNNLYHLEKDGKWDQVPDDKAKQFLWANPKLANGDPNPKFDKDLAKALVEHQKFNDWKTRMTEPMNLNYMEAVSIGNTWYEMLVERHILDDKFLFGDMFKPVLDFYATKWGGIAGGNWEDSICKFTTDYENAAGNGFAFTPGSTRPGAWIGSEVYTVSHPDLANLGNTVTERFYITTLSVSASGLTSDAGKDCSGRVKFYITMGKWKLDINGDGIYDVINLKCDDSYSLTGANAIVINTTTQSFNKVCIQFTDTGDLASAFKEQLEGGDKICRGVTEIGASPDIADCGIYCAGTGSADIGGGIDLNVDLGGGGSGGSGGEDKKSVKPVPGQPGLV